MIIIIPYRQDIRDGKELKFALRSIEKFLTGYTDVILVGDTPPSWFKGINIPGTDHPGRKEYNIYSKLLTGIKFINNYYPDFLMWNDDHFLQDKLNVTNIKYWHNGGLKEELNRRMGGRYRVVIENTLGMLPHIPFVMNFDIHTPIVYHKEKFIALFSKMEMEICVKSYYANESGVIGEFMEDCKINGQFTIQEIKKIIKGRLFFSTGANLCNEMGIIFQEIYPDKSRFEK